MVSIFQNEILGFIENYRFQLSEPGEREIQNSMNSILIEIWGMITEKQGDN